MIKAYRFLWVLAAAASILVLGGISFPADLPSLSSPARGTLNTRPAASWDDGLLCGSGNLGAIVMGDPLDETIIFSHGRLFLPWEKPLPPVNTAAHIGEIRKLLADGKYQQAADLVVELSKQQGYDRKRWTDPLVPAFDLKILMDANGSVRDYARTLDFSNGLASVRWQDDRGTFLRRMFVSRSDDAAVLSLQSTAKGGIHCRIRLATRPSSAKPGMDADYWNPEDKFKSGVQETATDASGHWLMYRSRFKKSWPGGLQGYEGVAGVFSRNGGVSAQNGEIAVEGAGEVLVVVKLAILTDYAQSRIPDMQRRADGLAPAGFSALLARHARLHGDIYNRVRLDLGGGPDRNLPVDELRAKSKIGNLNPALLEKEFDKGRYITLSASGDWPPALQGIWTGTWGPPWSGDYTQNGNVQSAIAGELSGNMAECMLSYFNYMDSMLPDFRETARRLFGTRGIHVPSRMSSHGLNNHFDRTWPMTFWTAGAAWAAHFYYDYWLYTQDRDFLVRRAIPFMKEAALFYEDFLFEGPDGRYVFSPSYSPENAPGNSKSQAAVNATMDISLTRELLTNLVTVCRQTGIEKDGVERWTRMLAKLPDYRINADGAIKEWAWDGLEDDYQHRHNSHLVAIFDGVPADIAGDPRLLQAFRKALQLRMEHRRSQSYREMAFGLVQLGLAATSLRDAETAFEIVDWLANDYWTPALNSTHEPKKLFNVDITGGLPAIVIKMLLFSEPGRIDLLPALAKTWTRGRVEGLSCRGQLLVKELSWDGDKIHAVLRSPRAQSAVLTVPGRIAGIQIAGGSVGNQDAAADRRTITLPAGRDVTVDIALLAVDRSFNLRREHP